VWVGAEGSFALPLTRLERGVPPADPPKLSLLKR
jgi:hypothetical protein